MIVLNDVSLNLRGLCLDTYFVYGSDTLEDEVMDYYSSSKLI